MGLVIALNKGRILKECLPILASCGVEPVEHPSESRKLIFDSRCGNHRLIVTRSADVLTYVDQGVADVGITGKDTLLEYGEGMSFYERLDLKIGLCRMMTAAPVGFVASPGVLRVAVRGRGGGQGRRGGGRARRADVRPPARLEPSPRESSLRRAVTTFCVFFRSGRFLCCDSGSSRLRRSLLDRGCDGGLGAGHVRVQPRSLLGKRVQHALTRAIAVTLVR